MPVLDGLPAESHTLIATFSPLTDFVSMARQPWIIGLCGFIFHVIPLPSGSRLFTGYATAAYRYFLITVYCELCRDSCL